MVVVLLLNKRFADTILVLLVPILVLSWVQGLSHVHFGVWATVAEVTTWIVGLLLIWRPPRRTRK
jgi:hypothetical protein